MTKPIIVTVPCGTNTVTAKDFLEQDGSGAMKKLDASGTPLGVAFTSKDTENNVGMVQQGLMNLPAAAASYNVGDIVEGNSSGVTAYSAGTKVGMVAETATISTGYSGTDTLKVYLNMPNLS